MYIIKSGLPNFTLFFILTLLHAETIYVDGSSSCSNPIGSLECPYITIQDAMDNVQPGDNVVIRAGNYFEHVKFSGIATAELPIIVDVYPGEQVVINGTIPITQDWVSYNNNGHTIYKTQLDTALIAEQMGESFKTVYQLFINDRMMIPSQIINYANPTNPTTGTPDFPEPGTVWEGKPDANNQTKLLIDVDSPEEWSYNGSTRELYIYTSNGLSPEDDNIRIRVLDRVLTSGTLTAYPNGIPYGIDGAENVIFRGIEFYAGAVGLFGTHHFTLEDCTFLFSTDNGGFNQNTPDLMYPSSMNQFLSGSRASVINCVFKYINDYPLNINDCDSSLVENCLFEYNDWTNGTHHWLWNGYSTPCTVRYVTIQNSMSPGLFTGIGSLVEYCLIQNLYEGPTYDGEDGYMLDGASIQRNNASTYFSTTRYCWIIHGGNINGFRFDSNPGGTYGKIHHMVSIRNRRGFRLKGDHHQVHHLLAYDNQTKDISLPDYKYTNNEGNFNTDFTNSASEEMYECAAPNCNRLGDGWLDYDKHARDDAGLWEGPGNAEYVLEMINDDKQDWGKPQLELASYYSRYLAMGQQSYDFRPREGSRFIDTGAIVDSVNDGVDYTFPHPVSFPGQNRRFVGNAPDIGPYEYGDSVYWIPGYRYSYPSFPIPSDGANNIPCKSSLIFNYPYKKDYNNTQAIVTMSGPGIDRTLTLDYPNNVVFQDFQPSGLYFWQVTVDGKNGGEWLFQIDDNMTPIQDRSIDVTLNTSTEWLQDQVLTIHGSDQYIPEGKEIFVPQTNEQIAFLKFDIPETYDVNWNIKLNLTVAELNVQGGYSTAWQVAWGGIVLYSYDNTSWSERDDETNIGLADYTLGTPIDTLTDLEPGETYAIDVSSVIQTPGKYSFALAAMDSSSRVLFWSKERNLGGIKLFEPVNDEILPHLTFLPNIGSGMLDLVLIEPSNDTIFYTPTSNQDSIDFSWHLSHEIDMTYHFNIQLPFVNEAGVIDTIVVDKILEDTSLIVSKSSLLAMLMEAKLGQGNFYWSVQGEYGNIAINVSEPNSFNFVNADTNFEAISPDKYELLSNYPNPFNSGTTLIYDLKNWSKVEIEIYDILGRNINDYKYLMKAPGRHRLKWKGKDKYGKRLSTGIYFYRLKAHDPLSGKLKFIKTNKMMLVK